MISVWSEVSVAIVDPTVVHAATLVNRDVGVVESRESLEVFRIERCAAFSASAVRSSACSYDNGTNTRKPYRVVSVTPSTVNRTDHSSEWAIRRRRIVPLA
jgi:hypothetical protein